MYPLSMWIQELGSINLTNPEICRGDTTTDDKLKRGRHRKNQRYGKTGANKSAEQERLEKKKRRKKILDKEENNNYAGKKRGKIERRTKIRGWKKLGLKKSYIEKDKKGKKE